MGKSIYWLINFPENYLLKFRSGPMRRRLDEPRQVRKEAAVIAISVCCGVPGLFCADLFNN